MDLSNSLPSSVMTFAEVIRYSELHPAGNDPIFVRLREIAEIVVDADPTAKSVYDYQDNLEDLEREIRDLRCEVDTWENDHREKCDELESTLNELKSLRLDMDNNAIIPLFKKEREALRAEIYDLNQANLKLSKDSEKYRNEIRSLKQQVKDWEEKYLTWSAISG